MNKFTWNDLIKIKKETFAKETKENTGVVCAFSEVKNQTLANKYNTYIGDWIYTIEFSDGSDLTIAEQYIEKC